jgi:hypothetical protein
VLSELTQAEQEKFNALLKKLIAAPEITLVRPVAQFWSVSRPKSGEYEVRDYRYACSAFLEFRSTQLTRFTSSG